MKRRLFLGTAITIGIAGCLGGDDSANGDNNDETADEQEQAAAIFEWSPDEPAIGEQVTFDASDSTGEQIEYRWEFGNGSTEESDEPQTTHIYGDIGEYTVSLEVTNEADETDQTRLGLSVVPPEEFVEMESLLVETHNELESIANLTTERQEENVSELRENVDSIQQKLDELDEIAASDGYFTEQLGAVRSVINFQIDLIDNHRLALEAFNALERALNTLYNEIEDLPDVPEQLDEFDEHLDEAVELHTDRNELRGEIETAHDSLNIELDESTIEYSSPLTQYFRDGKEDLNTIKQLIEMHRSYAESMSNLSQGREAFEADRWNDAVEQFSSASETLQQARDDLDQTAIRSLLNERDNFTQFDVGAIMPVIFQDQFKELIDLHVEAAEAGKEGDTVTATNTYEQATSELHNI